MKVVHCNAQYRLSTIRTTAGNTQGNVLGNTTHDIHCWPMLRTLGRAIHTVYYTGQCYMGNNTLLGCLVLGGWVYWWMGGWDNALLQWQCARMPIQLQRRKTRKVNGVCRNVIFKMRYDTDIDEAEIPWNNTLIADNLHLRKKLIYFKAQFASVSWSAFVCVCQLVKIWKY